MEQYFVSYTVKPTSGIGWVATGYRAYAIFNTNDLGRIALYILPTRRQTVAGRAKALKEYHDEGRITFGSGANSGEVRDIKITRLPAQDRSVLDRYLKL